MSYRLLLPPSRLWDDWPADQNIGLDLVASSILRSVEVHTAHGTAEVSRTRATVTFVV